MTQTDQIRAHLEQGHSLTSLQALQQFGCMRLAARVGELRDAGMQIDCEMVKTGTGKKVARYTKAKPAFALEPTA